MSFTSNCDSASFTNETYERDDTGIERESHTAPKEENVKWLQNQSNVLDEVDQLVEMMTAEKTTLTQKILKLEEERNGLHECEIILERENSQLKLENRAIEEKLVLQQEQNEEGIAGLKEALELAKKQLEETRAKVEELTSDLNKSKAVSKQLSERNSELEKKLQKFHSKNWSKSEIDLSENIKITHQLADMRHYCTALCEEKQLLQEKMKELHDRLKNSEGVVMAMKGRANNARKYEKELKSKCSTLEKALEVTSARSPVVVKVHSSEKTREELRLMEECRKKDEVVTRCLQELEISQTELKKSRQHIRKLEKVIQAEQLKNESMSAHMEEARAELEEEKKRMERLIKSTQEQKNHEFNMGKMEVERSMYKIEEELKRANEEISIMRVKVKTKERQWREEGKKWRQERMAFIKVHQDMTEKLKEGEKCSHDGDGGDSQLREAREDYRRLKEASTKRCTELAKEVWRLESILQDMHEHKQ